MSHVQYATVEIHAMHTREEDTRKVDTRYFLRKSPGDEVERGRLRSVH